MKISRTAGWLIALTVGGCSGSSLPKHVLKMPLGVRSDYHVNISNWPVDPNSDEMIAASGHNPILNLGYGGHEYPVNPESSPRPWSINGFPVLDIGDYTQIPLVAVRNSAGWEGIDDGYDQGNSVPKAFWPIPDSLKDPALQYAFQGARSAVDDPMVGSYHDKHLILFDSTRLWLWEMFNLVWHPDTNEWTQASGQWTDLSKPPSESHGHGMAGASGVPFSPGMISYEELFVDSAEVNHGNFADMALLRFAVVPPARHTDGTGGPDAPPTGSRLRLKASKDISHFPPELQKLFRAWKTYGLITCDSSGNLDPEKRASEGDLMPSYFFDPRWDAVFDAWKALGYQIFTDDFEIVAPSNALDDTTESARASRERRRRAPIWRRSYHRRGRPSDLS